MAKENNRWRDSLQGNDISGTWRIEESWEEEEEEEDKEDDEKLHGCEGDDEEE